jgi:hypothetical protein
MVNKTKGETNMEPIETEEITLYIPKLCTIEIYQDDTPENPRDWDNLGTLVTWTRKYEIGDRHEFDTPESFQDFMKSKPCPAVALPIYLYDHSGIMLSTSPFSDPWDSGQIGFIYVERKKICEQYNCKQIGPRTRRQVLRILRGEVEVYSHYLAGEVYGYRLLNDLGTELSSCWGFYSIEEAKAEAYSIYKEN